MSWRALPPAGNPIALSSRSAEPPAFSGYRAVWVDSGTAALALSFILARQRQPQVLKPQIVLPAYACPDLVAAAVYAGVRPVLADIGPDDPGYDFDSLESVLSENTVAVVAVNFLGIRERLPQLREMLSAWPAAGLIEDDAQWFPEAVADAPLAGDAVCLSFGRGKPVSLLGGGALLIRESFARPPDAESRVGPAADPGRALYWKIRAYNLLLSPLWYGGLSHVPGLNLGSTVLRTLQGIRALDPLRRGLLPDNVRGHLARQDEPARSIHALLPPDMDLPARLAPRSGRLLRYPVLCRDSQQRDALWTKLRRAGLGASAMYRHPLASIEGVNDHAVSSGGEGARRFADRLLTLPVHSGVDAESLERMGHILRSELDTGV